VRRILALVGLSKARYSAWTKRAAASALTDRRPIAPACDAVLPEEKAAVVAYALAHPKDGYRRLTWEMIDADVAYLSESSVYRILRDAELLARWKRSTHAGQAPTKPTRPHERWHTDLMYLRIADSWYFLVTVLDAYSRYVVHWELLTSMMASDVRLVIQQALEVTGATPRLVTDNVLPALSSSDEGRRYRRRARARRFSTGAADHDRRTTTRRYFHHHERSRSPWSTQRHWIVLSRPEGVHDTMRFPFFT